MKNVIKSLHRHSPVIKKLYKVRILKQQTFSFLHVNITSVFIPRNNFVFLFFSQNFLNFKF